MAINREDLKKVGLGEEVITKVLDMNHAEVDPLKDKASKYDDKKERADKLKADFDE